MAQHLIATILALGSALPAGAAAQMHPIFALLDLSRPGLEQVRRAVEADDGGAAESALKAYYRQRRAPVAISDRFRRPEPDEDYETEAARRVLRREFSFVGKPATLTHDIDWNSDPLQDIEWPIELNRHGPWLTLARAYWHTHEEQYAEDLAYQVADWIADNPRPESPRQARWTWRTLECGIRTSGTWPQTLFRAIDSEAFTPRLVCDMLLAVWEQTDYMTVYHGGGNWLVCERSGMLTSAVLFPEFADAGGWRERAWADLSAALADQVLPDGAQIELTPHYHSATLGSFRAAYEVAARNDVPAPAEYLDRMRSMYEYLLWVAKPDGFIPMFNDSDHDNVRSWMTDGAGRFDRPDMLYLATGGTQGEPPDRTSHAFPYAGQYIMRSGWTMDDVYLAMDAGPYGYGHQHEDKLTVDVWGYGEELIADPGRFTYAGGKWRSYFLNTESHSTVLVDGRGQRRRGTPRETWVAREPLHNDWLTTDALDLAVGAYEDGYQGADEVIHLRKVLFVRPDYFVVTDLLLPAQEGPGTHRATVQFQLAHPDAVLREGNAVHAGGDRAGVLLCPATPHAADVTVHQGEEDPPAGWVAWSLHRALKVPAGMVRYHIEGEPPLIHDTVILPYRGRVPPPIAVTRLPVASERGPLAPHRATALEIRGDGWRDVCFVAHEPGPAEYRFGDRSTRGEVAVFRSDGDGDRLPDGFGSPAPNPCPEVDLDGVTISVHAQEPTAFALRYGYATGGGLIYTTPTTDPALQAELSIPGAKEGMRYAYEAIAVGGDGPRAVQRGTIVIPQPRTFDFDDGTTQGWAGAGLAQGYRGSAGALSLQAEATADVRYITASRPLRLAVAEATAIDFAYRAPLADGGKWCYAKVTLRDREGLDWSAYFADGPVERWQELSLGLSDFRGDTQDTPQQGGPMPAGTRVKGISFTLRKDATVGAVAPMLEVDDLRIQP